MTDTTTSTAKGTIMTTTDTTSTAPAALPDFIIAALARKLAGANVITAPAPARTAEPDTSEANDTAPDTDTSDEPQALSMSRTARAVEECDEFEAHDFDCGSFDHRAIDVSDM